MKNIIIALLVSFSFFSCEKIPNFQPIKSVVPTDGYIAPQICIEGSISSELKYHTLKLINPQLYSDDIIRIPFPEDYSNYYNKIGISEAKVSLQIDGKRYEYIEAINHPQAKEDQKYKGIYMSVDSIQGLPTKTHTLLVEYNNVTYEATDIMPAVEKIHALEEMVPKEKYNSDPAISFDRVTFGREKGYVVEYEFILDYYEYNGYEIDSSTHYVVTNFNYNYFFSQYVSPALMEEAKWVESNVLYGYRTYDNVILKKHSISEEYQSYLIDVFSETIWQTSDFRTISASPSTNVSNGGIGYFAATSVDTQHVIFEQLLDASNSLK